MKGVGGSWMFMMTDNDNNDDDGYILHTLR